MKLSITTENNPEITGHVLSVIKQQHAALIKLEVDDGALWLQTQPVEKSVQGTIASMLMQIPGVKWVNQVDAFPVVEQQHMMGSLLDAMDDPILGINTKGQIVFANPMAHQIFTSEDKKLKMPDKMKGIFTCLDWQEKINDAGASDIPVSVSTTAGNMLLDVQATKNPAGQMSGALLHFKQLKKVMTSVMVLNADETSNSESLVSESQAFDQLLKRAQSVATVEAPLSLIGESGTGKAMVASTCHKLSQRKNNLFTAVDCQATKGEALEKALFGTQQTPGLLALNTAGTIYFSHIEFMSLPMQRKLSRLLSQSGDNQARIMTSSAKRLHQYGDQLDSDLVNVLDILRLDVPALRERKEDIMLLADGFLAQFNLQNGRQVTLAHDAVERLKRYYWPGNVNQLRQTIYKAFMATQDDVILESQLDLETGVNIEAELEGLTLPEAVNEFEKHFLQHWYQKYPSSRKLAAQLGVSHTTIAQKINKYQLNKNVEN